MTSEPDLCEAIPIATANAGPNAVGPSSSNSNNFLLNSFLLS